ncbi:hypothetical protein [Mycoplasma feriruminatoris]|uniref:hypothetical protein n=1 Tax=Mycoplasma feriruminatoris TaxID=1179777 RepID=UPI0002A4F4D4|nr:hypothetical protein [Mycoplasma feriruminatoris]UKS53952.1 hypothetical protein D500_00296 [Mycoplasma feriruminatoris]VZK65138.1 hypothetical protein MF5292_00303 [Mycoplasma feriruminatoris]VZR75284.1 hypothetical protein MF5294_00304 [Mycoplasma feriruminatoris]VZR97401.1 hypothetical protein MF5293_00303 [Mycoplasma feriruminatoris]
MLLKGKIILTSVISSLALVSISGFIGYKIGLINNVEYKNRNKRLLKIIGFNRFETSDDWIDYRRGYSYQGEFKKRGDELLLIKDNIYKINSENSKVTFFYNRGNEIYKYVISNISYDVKEITNFLLKGSKNNKDILDVKKANITKTKVE